jgi:glycosyltransferase involved in cell wall biosynthesis
MQNKLLEYLAMGRPVVATSAANEGLGATPGRHLVLADDTAAFAAAILALLAEPARAAALGAAGRRLVVEEWTWEAHFLRLEAAFLAALDGAPAAALSFP